MSMHDGMPQIFARMIHLIDLRTDFVGSHSCSRDGRPHPGSASFWDMEEDGMRQEEGHDGIMAKCDQVHNAAQEYARPQ